MKAQTGHRRPKFCRAVLLLVAATVLLPVAAMAQSSTTTARTPGAPAGTYQLGNTDTINLFNGNLNYSLPLLRVGGRGEAGAGLGVVIEAQWDMKETDLGNGYLQHAYSNRWPDPLALVGSVRLDVRAFGTNVPCDNQGDHFITYMVSMIYVEPDGTEHALRDRVVHGTPVDTCALGARNLGNVFESTSGDFITFVTDTNIYTNCFGVSGCTNSVDGYLFFRNGSKARVSGQNLMWVQDRNGNKIEYRYEVKPSNLDAKRLIKVIDSVGREVDILYNVNEPGYGRNTQIKYKGFGGQDKIIRIGREADVMNVLRTTQPYDSTTPVDIEFDDPDDSIILGGGTSSSPDFVKAVWLPDGRSYQFSYNILGQLARVKLPTGGAVEYDYEDIFHIPFAPVPGPLGPVTNRVSEKRVYDGNNVLVSRTVLSTPSSYTQGVISPSRGGVVRDVELFAPDGQRLGKSRHYFYGAPNTDYGLLVPWWHGKEFRSETFDSDGVTLLQVIENDWRQRTPSWCSSFPPCSFNPSEQAPTNSPFIVETKTTLVDANLVSKVSAVSPAGSASNPSSWAFDAYNNQTDAWQYDYSVGQPGTLLKHTHSSYINNVTPPSQGSLFLSSLTDTTSVYAVGTAGQETLASSSQTLYDEYAQYPLLIYDPVIGWQDPGGVRGNPTTVRRWLDTNGTWIETHAQFDQLGNVRKSWDALGRLSETTYADAFTDGVNRNTHAFPTQSTSPIPDSNNAAHSSATAFSSHSVYDYYSGLVKTSTDINNQTTTLEYDDTLDRLTKVINPTGGGWTGFEYGDAVGNLYVKTTTAFDETRNVESFSYFDGLGRSVRSFSPKGGGVWVVGDTQYDAAGRVRRSSKPYQANQSPSLNTGINPANNWVTTQYDALGRVTSVTTADGSQAQTSYLGNTVTATDAALKKRKTVSDALGRLKQVVEGPGGSNLVTDYKYDVLGNLRRVDQGQQHRYYMYDSLSRLIRSRNPEQDVNPDLNLNDQIAGNGQWTTSVDYYNNGDLSAKTDARGIKIEYLYDNLNRLYRRTYTATRTLVAGTYTPSQAVDYYYDGVGLPSAPQNSLGKVTRVSSPVSETRYMGFDAMGRVTSSEQVVDGQTYQMPSYAYNLAGALVSQVYPSGRTVKNDYDEVGKLSIVSGLAPNQSWKTYASDFDYSLTDTGAVSQVKLGNGRWESTVYNKRLQPTLVRLGTTHDGTELMKLNYGYGTTDNNGDIHTQTITVPTSGVSTGFTATQTYGYDDLDRLNSAVEVSGGQTSWRQTFNYDQFGNREVVTAGQSATTPEIVGDNPVASTANNRITPRAGELYQYDDAGNLTVDRAGNAYSFDGENMQATYTNAVLGQVSSGQYFYDGDGRRVKKVVGSETTVFVYNAFGQVVAEYATSAQQSASPTTYVTTDPLGSPRVSTDGAGQVRARHDYLPFGEELSSYGGRSNHAEYRADSVRQRYTGYQRDDESKLDYAGARYYSSQAGRFTSVDPLMASASTISPQSFNRYTYALNNPYRYIDPSGMEPFDSEVDRAFAYMGDMVDRAHDEEQALRDAAREEAKKKEQEQKQQQTNGGQDRRYVVTVTEVDDVDYITENSVPVLGFVAPVGLAPVVTTTAGAGAGSVAAPVVAVSITAVLSLALLEVGNHPGASPYVTLADGTRAMSSTAGSQAFQNLPNPSLTSAPWTNQPDRLDGDMVVVRGGATPLPPAGTVFSGAVGFTVYDAAASVPHGTIRSTTVNAILTGGGIVVLIPEMSRSGVMNHRHVNIIEGPISTFSAPFPNPVPPKLRIP